ncbi:MAG: biotin--[acetyl-CoA-carboxylase] ligase [Elusimicrobiota bacterium]
MSKCIKFARINSTQDYAKKIAKESPSGTVVVAEEQTKGRGQFGRTWSSQKGGLYFSIILKPKISPDKIPLLTLKMAWAIIDSLKKIVGKKYKFWVKPPNDVMVTPKSEVRSHKKIAGILTESSITRNKIDWVIIGVGVNINNEIPKNLKDIAISLKEIIGKKTNITNVFNKITVVWQISHFSNEK